MPATAETIAIAIAISRARLRPVRARSRALVCAFVGNDGCAQARSMRAVYQQGA
jgi:hypothetical protein